MLPRKSKKRSPKKPKHVTYSRDHPCYRCTMWIWCVVNGHTCNIVIHCNYLLLHNLFIGLFSRTNWVSRYQRCNQSGFKWGKRCWGFGMLWHQLDDMQIICISLQTDNHTNASSVDFFAGGMLFLTPSQQCWNTEGRMLHAYIHTHTRLSAFFPGLRG